MGKFGGIQTNDLNRESKRITRVERALREQSASRRLRRSAITLTATDDSPTDLAPDEYVLQFGEDGQLYAIGADQIQRPVIRETLRSAPFANNSFENINGSGFPYSWSDFWRSPGQLVSTSTDWSSFGSRALMLTIDATAAVQSTAHVVTPWAVTNGATLSVTFEAKADGVQPTLEVLIISNISTGNPDFFVAGSVVSGESLSLSASPKTYTATITIPPTHTRARLYFRLRSGNTSGGAATAYIDNVGVVGGEVSTVGHGEYLRRAVQSLIGGGTRTLTTAGDVAWGTPFRVIGAGRTADEAPSGFFDIAMPANGTVIPVHHSTARTSHTVAGGVIRLNTNEALWYQLPFAAASTSQPSQFHIAAHTLDDGYSIEPGWVLVCARGDYATNPRVEEFRWGDGRTEDPWRQVTYTAPWTSYGSSYVIPAIGGGVSTGVKRTNGIVELAFAITGGSSGAVAFVLPNGYKPGQEMLIYSSDGPVVISANGNVTPFVGSTVAVRGSGSFNPTT